MTGANFEWVRRHDLAVIQQLQVHENGDNGQVLRMLVL
jgi:hypothetical protein